MKAQIALFTDGHGHRNPHLYFPEWTVGDFVFKHVHVFPHRCNPTVCEYGDHVHVDVFDEPDEIIDPDGFELDAETEGAIEAFLRAQHGVDRLIGTLETALTRNNN